MGRDCGIRGVLRRSLIALGAVAAMSLIGAGPASAQLGLGGSLSGDQNGGLVSTVVDTVSEVAAPVLNPQQTGSAPEAAPSATEPAGAEPASMPVSETRSVASATGSILGQATPVVQEATANVTSTVQPVLETATPLVQATVQPVLETATPLLEAVEPIVSAVTQPVLEAAAPVLETARPLLDTTVSLLGATEPLLGATSSVSDSVPSLEGSVEPAPLAPVARETSVLPSAKPSIPAAQPHEAAPVEFAGSSSSVAVPAAGPTGEPALIRALGLEQKAAVVPTWLAPVDWSAPAATPGHASGGTTAASLRRPAPGLPGNPLGLLGSVSAGSSSGASLLVFAAFVAALLLAAPGLGRRLRPHLAPWPLPIARPSLERPG